MSLLLGGGVGGLCADKIPPQEFALKMQGGLCARGGGRIWDTTYMYIIYALHTLQGDT